MKVFFMQPNITISKGTSADLLEKLEEGCIDFMVTASSASAGSIRKTMNGLLH